jgi:signal transduction histidine kinase
MPQTPKTKPDSPPRWHWLYYVLAAFDVAAVVASLLLNRGIMRNYLDSVVHNRAWANVARDASELSEVASLAAAPGNDVFETGAPAQDRERATRSLVEMNSLLARLSESLAALPYEEDALPLVEDLRTTRGLAREMARDLSLVFGYFESGQTDRATNYAATLNRRAATINSALAHLRTGIDRLQSRHMVEQTTAAENLQRSEFLIGGLITLMVLGAVYYGRVLAKQVALVTQGKEAYRHELEVRVAGRTADLTAANQNRAELLRQLITAQEDERRKISRDLHDGVGQSLTYIIKSMQSAATENSVASSDSLAKLREHASETLDEVRRLARGLRPTILDDLGLCPALERLAEEFRTAQDAELALDVQLPSQNRLPDTMETTIYRVIQESLANIVKHAGATHVTVSLSASDSAVVARIADNGRGLPVEASGKPSMGLASIRERAALLGGQAEITSRPEQGTTVSLTLPLDGQRAATNSPTSPG